MQIVSHSATILKLCCRTYMCVLVNIHVVIHYYTSGRIGKRYASMRWSDRTLPRLSHPTHSSSLYSQCRCSRNAFTSSQRRKRLTNESLFSHRITCVTSCRNSLFLLDVVLLTIRYNSRILCYATKLKATGKQDYKLEHYLIISFS